MRYQWTNDPQELPSAGEMRDIEGEPQQGEECLHGGYHPRGQCPEANEFANRGSEDNCSTCGYPEGYGCSDCEEEPILPKDW